jgi:hypothetical protein
LRPRESLAGFLNSWISCQKSTGCANFRSARPLSILPEPALVRPNHDSSDFFASRLSRPKTDLRDMGSWPYPPICWLVAPRPALPAELLVFCFRRFYETLTALIRLCSATRSALSSRDATHPTWIGKPTGRTNSPPNQGRST